MRRLTIRPIVGADLESVLKMEKKYFANAWDRRFFVYMLEKQSTTGIVACLDNYPVGFSVFRRLKNKKTGDKRMYLDSMAVKEAYRRDGIGTAMMAKMFSTLSEKVSVAETHLNDSDLVSHLFLRGCGWIAAETIMDEDGECVHRMVFRFEWLKSLPPKKRFAELVKQ